MRSSRRRSILSMLGCAAAAAVAVPIIAVSAPPGTKAPDLRADPVSGIVGPGVYGDTGSYGANRLLVRFEGYVTNVGNGPLEIRGNPQLPLSDDAGPQQYAWTSSQGPGSQPTERVSQSNLKVLYEGADGHNHFHLKRAMEYSLWSLSGATQVAPSQKVGFCLYDSQPAPISPVAAAPQVYVFDVTRFCQAGHQYDATSLRMGVGPGWRDIYNKDLAFQWIDVSATQPGEYQVGSLADPDNSVWEGGGETNVRVFAAKHVTVPGYIAKPVTVTQANGAQTVSLVTTSFGSPGPRDFRIVTPPAHGSLSVATGQAFAGPTVTYTPAAGYSGPDSFVYSARDRSFSFPTSGSEPTATASVLSAQPAVAISGAPQTLVAGTGVQLSATVFGVSGGVTWSTTGGTISPTGLLTAPATPPAGGSVTVKATSVTNPAVNGQVVIAIAPVPVAQPAPLPVSLSAPSVSATASKKLLSRLIVGHVGKRTVVGTITTGPKAGRVDVIVSFAGKVLGRCGARVGPRKTVSCKITLKRDYPLARIRFTAKLSILGKSTAVRRAFVATRG